VVTTLHGTDITLVGQEKSFFTITKFSIERSDAVTAVSKFLREETYKAFGCTDCAIDVIPNFVNLAEYHPAQGDSCRSAFAPAGAKILMHISNFRPVKRIPDVVRTFARVRKEMPAVLVFVGDGPERPAAEALVSELGLAHDVRFLGKVDAVADLLQCADLFLLPSASESFGLAGLPEVVGEGAGALVPVGDTEEMSRQALALLGDPEALRTARLAAVRAAEPFSADRIVPRYEALYRRVLGR
jgi:N-acetyl-alpha-D-glucosaminyl L-malate synthase BshA